MDPKKEIENLFQSLNLEREGDSEDREEQSQKARENLKERLKVYFSNEMNSTDQGGVLNSFYEFARNDDQVKELVSQILPEDYQGLGMLQELFVVEGLFSIMLREVIEELFQEEPDLVPVSSLVKEKSDAHLQNTAREIERIWNQVRVDKSRKREIIGRIVQQTDPEGIERIVLNQIEDLELRDLVSLLSHGPRKTEPMAVTKIIEGLFKKPLEMITREKDKFEYRKVDRKITLEFRLVKGIPYGLWGLNAGVCTADDVTLWQKQEFMLLALIDRESGKVYGFVEIFKQKINGREVLTVPGIDPNIELLSQVKEEEVYSLIESALIKIARRGGYQALYYPQESHLLSNRPGIVKIVQEKYESRKTDLPLTVNWNESPSPYPFSEVYEVWVEETKPFDFSERADLLPGARERSEPSDTEEPLADSTLKDKDEPSSPPFASIFYPIYRKGKIIEPKSFKDHLHNFLYELGDPIKASPSWETAVFMLVGTFVIPAGLVLFFGIDVNTASDLGNLWSISMFAFSHTIVEWWVRAKEHGLEELFKPKALIQDAIKFFINNLLSLSVTHIYLYLDPITATVLTLALHTLYNFFIEQAKLSVSKAILQHRKINPILFAIAHLSPASMFNPLRTMREDNEVIDSNYVGEERHLDALKEIKVEQFGDRWFIRLDGDMLGTLNLLYGKGIIGTLESEHSLFREGREILKRVVEEEGGNLYIGEGADEIILEFNGKFGTINKKLNNVIAKYTIAFRDRYAVLRIESRKLTAEQESRIRALDGVLVVEEHGNGFNILVNREGLQNTNDLMKEIQKVVTNQKVMDITHTKINKRLDS